MNFSIRKLNFQFMRVYFLLAEQSYLFLFYVLLCLLTAVTEGLGVSLLAPLLSSQGGGDAFAGIPVLGALSSWFTSLPPNERIKTVAGVMFVVIVARGVLQYVVDVMGTAIPLALQRKLCLRGYDAMMAVEIGYIHQRDMGTLIMGLRDWAQRSANLLTQLSALVWNGFLFLIYVGLMLSLSVKLTVFAVIFVGVLSLVLRWFVTNPLRRQGARFADAYAALNQVNHETLSGMRVIRLLTAEAQMREIYRGALDDMVGAQRNLAYYQSAANPVLTAGAGILLCAMLFGSAMLNDGSPQADWLAPLLMFLFLLMRLLGPVSQINNARNRMVSELPVLELMENFFQETAANRQQDGQLAAEPLRSGVCFENVQFAYSPTDNPTIKGLSLTIPRGQMVAIVGPSGAGKTTLISLLARLYDPQQGRIVVDGRDLRDLQVGLWRRRLSVVSQDIFLFNDTVAHNIAFGREVSLDDVKAAARKAAADEFIASMPEGYDTELGDRGVRLSGGQQQRIAIARAILADPDLLVFDEATSHLDALTERAIELAVQDLRQDRTVVVIAHRLSTIRRADKVVVMKDGCVVEEGRHEDLVAARGVYWEMLSHQRLELVDDAETGQ